ncbi:MAG: hypothetical protein AABW73_00095 [Nanoarchaeota archaeon]
MHSKTHLRIVGSSQTRQVVAHYKSPESKKRKSSLTFNCMVRGTNNDHFHTPIDELAALLERLKGQRIIPKYGLLQDAGAGDARVLASAASIGLGAYGAERDEDFFLYGVANLTYLQSRGAIPNGELASIIPGDFNEESTYEESGFKPNDFGTLFHSSIHKTPKKLVERVVDQAKPGTIFVNINHCRRHQELHKMKVVESEIIRDSGIPFYAHVYKKRKK